MRMISLITSVRRSWQAAQVQREAARELAAMSVCELSDIGITRLDVSRLFEPRLAPELRSRGGIGRVATTATFRTISQGPAARTSLELPV
jgi:uncharacterized protein YjiS (DUF1127 family)